MHVCCSLQVSIPLVLFDGLRPVDAFWHAGPARVSGLPDPLPLSWIGLDYKDVPDIPINNTADPFLRLPRLAPYIAAA